VKEGFFKTTLSPAGLSSGIVWVHYDPPIADEKITRELLKPGIDAVKTAGLGRFFGEENLSGV